ncbi:hypothetical protein [Polynucleobacter necessarius]|uniref:hypothetical protein n=1 Tax=Polynucleobacter necessarius TaxID=576610 RepID=UPI001E32F85F|nr:hypothetical protein [Polynucleobacter necessarius]
MQALKTGEGLGAGYQDQYQVAIFKTPGAIDQFLLTSIDGQRGGIDVDANFSSGSGGTLYLVDQQLNNAATLNSLPKKKSDSK